VFVYLSTLIHVLLNLLTAVTERIKAREMEDKKKKERGDRSCISIPIGAGGTSSEANWVAAPQVEDATISGSWRKETQLVMASWEERF
jgi:hypothetical protein